jgi:hypothetical protein
VAITALFSNDMKKLSVSDGWLIAGRDSAGWCRFAVKFARIG